MKAKLLIPYEPDIESLRVKVGISNAGLSTLYQHRLIDFLLDGKAYKTVGTSDLDVDNWVIIELKGWKRLSKKFNNPVIDEFFINHPDGLIYTGI